MIAQFCIRMYKKVVLALVTIKVLQYSSFIRKITNAFTTKMMNL